MRFTVVIFDLDGTLVDSAQDIAAAVNRTLSRYDLPGLPPEEIIGFVGDGVRALIERTVFRLARGDSEALITDFKADYRRHCLDQTHAYPGAKELLSALNGTPVGVVTNKPFEFAREVLAGVGLLRLVGALVGGDEIGRLKPDPEPVRLCLSRLALSPSGGLLVGDHANDVNAGRAAGLSTCGALWGFDGGQSVRLAAPDYLCTSLGDVQQLIVS